MIAKAIELGIVAVGTFQTDWLTSLFPSLLWEAALIKKRMMKIGQNVPNNVPFLLELCHIIN
jgi:hypothetical protein